MTKPPSSGSSLANRPVASSTTQSRGHGTSRITVCANEDQRWQIDTAKPYHGDPAGAFRRYRSSSSLGERDGEAISHERSGSEEGLSAWSLSRSLRRGLGEGHPRGSLYNILRQQGVCSPCRGAANRRDSAPLHKCIVASRNKWRGEGAQQPDGYRTGALEQRSHRWQVLSHAFVGVLTERYKRAGLGVDYEAFNNRYETP
jgi:hypothetical protein